MCVKAGLELWPDKQTRVVGLWVGEILWSDGEGVVARGCVREIDPYNQWREPRRIDTETWRPFVPSHTSQTSRLPYSTARRAVLNTVVRDAYTCTTLYAYCDVLVLLSRPLSRRRVETCCSPQYPLITPLSPTTNDALATVVVIKVQVLFAHDITYNLSILYLSCSLHTHFVFVLNTQILYKYN